MSKTVVLNQAPHNLIEKGLAVLGNLGVTPKDWGRKVVTDPIARMRIAALMRGEITTDIGFGQLLEREIELTKKVCQATGVVYPGDSMVEQALRKAEGAWGAITEHDRFVPEGLNRRVLLETCQSAGLKLNGDPQSANCDGEDLPTVAGVIRHDLRTIMVPTDLVGRPFYLPANEQEKWAGKQGGDGLTSVEETLFLSLRKILELGVAPWAAGWCRCRNFHGSGSSLYVCWDADGGLEVDDGFRGDYGWNEGALVRKFLALDN